MKRFTTLTVAIVFAITCMATSIGTLTASAAGNVKYPAYKSGAKGAEVYAIQYLLYYQGLGNEVGTIDGVYGPKTTNAVKSFQSAKRLTRDGIAGDKTFRALNPYLKNGSKNDGVKALTYLLRNKFKLTSQSVTNTFNSTTVSAVKQLQKYFGLPQTGEVCHDTWATLFKASSVNIPEKTKAGAASTKRAYSKSLPNQKLYLSDGSTTPYFTVKEIMCGGANSSCKSPKCPGSFVLDSKLVDVLHGMRLELGALKVSGPLRCSEQAKKVNSSTASTTNHLVTKGLAVDVQSLTGKTQAQVLASAKKHGAKGDTYAGSTYIHVAVNP